MMIKIWTQYSQRKLEYLSKEAFYMSAKSPAECSDMERWNILSGKVKGQGCVPIVAPSSNSERMIMATDFQSPRNPLELLLYGNTFLLRSLIMQSIHQTTGIKDGRPIYCYNSKDNKSVALITDMHDYYVVNLIEKRRFLLTWLAPEYAWTWEGAQEIVHGFLAGQRILNGLK